MNPNDKRLSRKWFLILFISIWAVGIFARTWEYTTLPGGLHRDEASHAYDAYSVLKFGEDRNAVRYPLQFVTWGDGQTVLYPYLATPFMTLLGLTPLAIRLPNLIAGILVIPLVFLVGKRIRGERFGLLVMFLMAISPWNIIGSRWGLEPYFLPFLFLVGFYFFLCSSRANFWFIPSMACFGFCLFTYSTAFSAIPIFLILAIPLLVSQKRINWKTAISGIVIFCILAIPNILYILINKLDLPSIRIWPFTIPHLLLEPRFVQQAVIFNPDSVRQIVNNILVMAQILWTGSDNWLRNSIPPYGYGYPLAALFGIAGLILIAIKKQLNGKYEMALIGLWLVSALSIGAIQSTNSNRICFSFIPIMFFSAIFFEWMADRFAFLLPIVVITYFGFFIGFTISYHSQEYKSYAAGEFNAGLLPAIHYASKVTTTDICITPLVNDAYIFVLFSEAPDPRQVVNLKKDYVNPWRPFNRKGPFDRYKMLASQCHEDQERVAYIIREDEATPELIGAYSEKDFGIFKTYIPQ
jgi:hypothetical protein